VTTLDTISVDITADSSRFRSELEQATRMAEGFGRSITSALEGAVLRGNSLSDVLRSLALDLSRMALKSALQPLQSGLAGFLDNALGAIGGGQGLAVTPFARGGVLDAPALFPLGSGSLGLAGEAGAEAILPLTRGADGQLGVRSNGSAGATQITFNISSPDAASFRRSETQIGAMVSRAVARGQRNL